jgi:2-oxoacid:acceptor oxidoreductase gamma subunit (pyruvate/2-ketoisovalerate family)
LNRFNGENNLQELLEVRWHGRGGQGCWTASELLARAAITEKKFIQSFPEFGPERMGAPVAAFTRISNEPIQIHSTVYDPDVVAVLDPTLLRTVPVTKGLKENGTIIVNSEEKASEMSKLLNTKSRVLTVPATEIAMKILGRPITNTAMLGAVARVTGIVALASIQHVIEERFGKTPLSEKNRAVIKKIYEGIEAE